jgi:demethoxyubiquinone hydroxylase (CLK1/Coq7/Cat5 family)
MAAKLAAKTSVEIWFQDEMRLGQKNPRTRRWARRGSRPRALADLRTKSAYLFGAICPKRGTGAAIVMPRADTQAMQHHLDEIARNLAPKAHAIIVLDQAGWHTTSKLRRKTSPCSRCHPSPPS